MTDDPKTAWDVLLDDGNPLDEWPAWVRVGQVIRSKNDEIEATIRIVTENKANREASRITVELSGKNGPTNYNFKTFLRIWAAVEPGFAR